MRKSLTVRLVVMVLSTTAKPWSVWEETQRQLFEEQLKRLNHPDISVFWMQSIPNVRRARRQKILSWWIWLLRFSSRIPLSDHVFSRINFTPPWLLRLLDLEPHPKVSLEPDNTLAVHQIESYELMGVKTLSCLEWVLANLSPTHVLRTNSSSYIDLQSLIGFLETASPRRLYGGLPRTFGNVPYVNGAGILMSRDVCESLVRAFHNLRIDLVDDVAIGELLSKEGYEITPLPRSDQPEFPGMSNLDVYHFRCKDAARTSELLSRVHRVRLALNRN